MRNEIELIDREALLLDVRGMNDGWRDPKPAYTVETLIKDQPTVDAVPLDQLAMLLAWLFHGCPANAYPSNEHACHPMCSDELREKHCSGFYGTDEDRWRTFLCDWMAGGMEVPDEMHMILENQME